MSLVEERLSWTEEERQKINTEFAAEADRFALRYRCVDCIHLCLPNTTCSLKYPNQMLTDPAVMAVYHDNQYVFCKDFEMVVS